MEDIVFTLPSGSREVLEKFLALEDLSDLGAYFVRLLKKDLLDRRCKLLGDRVREELLRCGARRVVSLDIEEFARDPRSVADFVTRSREPVTIHVDGQPRLFVQDVRDVACGPWEAFDRDGG